MKNFIIFLLLFLSITVTASAQFSMAVTAVVDSGDSISNYFDCKTYHIKAIQIPAGMENDSIYWQTCDTYNGTYLNVYLSDQTLLRVDAYRGELTVLDTPRYFLAMKRYVKIIIPQHVADIAGRTVTLIIGNL